MRTPKFNFVPERQLKKRTEPSNNIAKFSIMNNGQLVLNSHYLSIYELDNKHVRFFADLEKRALGWMIIDGDTDFETLNDARQIKIDKNGTCKFSVRPLLRQLGWEDKTSVKGLEVMIYKSPLYSGDIHYIRLPDKEVEFTGEGSNLKE